MTEVNNSQNNFSKIKNEMKNKKNKAEARNNLEELAEPLTIQPAKIEFLVFHVAEEEFAFKLSFVKEIIRVPEMAIVPNAPYYIAGLCELRGHILPVIDSHKWFGMQNLAYKESSRVIVTDIFGKNIGMMADKVSEVLSTEIKNVKEPPENVKSINGRVVNGMLLLDNGKRIIMLLDAEKLGELDVEDSQQQVHANSGLEYGTETIEEKQIVVFSVENEEYAIDINDVKEIINLPDIMKVPNAAEYIEGILNLRNSTIAVINLRKLLKLNHEVSDQNGRILIIDTQSITYGIISDKVSGVLRIPKNSLMDQCDITNGDENDYLRGVISLNNGSRLIMLLEPNKIITMNYDSE